MVSVAVNRKLRVFGMTLLVALGLGGCSSPQFSRIEGNREDYESWSLDVRQAVLDGRVEPGMTPQMVEVSWGQPSEVISRANGPHEDEIWIYRTTSGGDYIYPTPVMGGSYPGGGYPGGGYPTGGIGRSGVGVGVGTGGINIGTGGAGGAMMPAPVMVRPPVTSEREVVFRDGVVIRADKPEPKSSSSGP
jgi:hypothetical protein